MGMQQLQHQGNSSHIWHDSVLLWCAVVNCWIRLEHTEVGSFQVGSQVARKGVEGQDQAHWLVRLVRWEGYIPLCEPPWLRARHLHSHLIEYEAEVMCEHCGREG